MSAALSLPFHTDKLTGENWFAWKIKITHLFELHQLLGHIQEQIQVPKEGDTEARANWERNDTLARAMIVMNLCDDQVVYVAQAKTASDMWKSLLDAYDAETHPSMPLLRLKLYKSLLEEGGDIVKHHAELKALRRRLHLIGAFCHAIPAEVRCKDVLCMIEEEYDRRCRDRGV
ncbi:hypothetical protein BDN72DRAFT_849908 [Pluteus cervinus]|uniref:Uncharacterized protein n=1 Tax=Pluteus cervinus TaxID=181527 RepID=A0ACD3A5Q2_9AGAR|nr:hypothetical protein BDN72DRAFT_849908 [Pluteus cervinus]